MYGMGETSATQKRTFLNLVERKYLEETEGVFQLQRLLGVEWGTR
jgi:hypothetical protein